MATQKLKCGHAETRDQLPRGTTLKISCRSEPEPPGRDQRLRLREESSPPHSSEGANRAPVAGQELEREAGGYPFRAPAHLTPRETQILRLIAEGHHNAWIARMINRSIKTVEKHRQNVNNKLHIHDTAGLTRYALSVGLTTKELRQPAPQMPIHLTPRETQVLKLIAEGLPNKGIADELHRSINTVENHRESMMSKLHIHEIASLTRYAVSIGLVVVAMKSI